MQVATIQLANACKIFASPEGGKVRALDNIDLEVRHNEFLTLLGPSGCGKTTLLQSIGGFVNLDSGKILIDGTEITHTPPHKRPVNTVFQSYALFPHMSVEKNVSYALEVRGMSDKECRSKANEALFMVGLSDFGKRRPHQLSGGQQQRVALARAIIARPKLLLLDEPLSALDRSLRHSMQIELKNLQNELGISFVFVTHDQEEALTMSDRIAVLRNGRIEQIAPPREIYTRPANAFVAGFIGASNLFEGFAADGIITLGGGETLHYCRHNSNITGNVTAIIRPEQLLLASESEALPRIDVTVEQIIFVGASFELYMRTANGHKITVMAPASAHEAVFRAENQRQTQIAYDPSYVHIMQEKRGYA